MGVLFKEKFAAFNRSLRTSFRKAFQEAATDIDRFVMRTTSDGPSESYGWLGDLPTIREWVSDRSFESFRAYTYEIKNRDWEGGFEVDRNDIEDDRTGQYAIFARDLAAAGPLHYAELVWNLLNDAFTKTAYDGQFFFDTDHTWGSNKGTGVLSEANLESAMVTMMQFKNEQGTKYIRVRPTHLVVPPQLWATARKLVEQGIKANGEENMNSGMLELVTVPELATNPTRWFLMDLSREIKPFILQVRRPWDFISFDDETVHEQVFMRKKIRYSIDARHNAGYGMPQLAWGSDGTV